MTGDASSVDVNAWEQHTYGCLNHVTLYPSPYMVLTNKGYTKHYYAGTERVAARIGGGGLNALQPVIGNDVELRKKADILFRQSLEQVNHRVLGENDLKCIMNNEFARDEFGKRIDGIPYHVRAKVQTDYWQFKDMIHSMLEDLNNGQEKDVYFYHSDHLGSASWITDCGGVAVQHIQYLPYGEPYINQRPFGYSERFTFTGKERDEKTGYGYFGARYMDHELMTMWLSVDPMADKYPSISPYAYCAWNPVKLVDPDGKDVYITGDAAEQATSQLSSRRITVTRDKNTGKLSYQINGNGKLLKREKRLIEAINDSDVRINVHASNQRNYYSPRDGKFDNTKTGQFLGVKYNPSPNDDNPYKATTQQLVNPSLCEQRDNQFSTPSGLAIYHEITESHQAGLFSIDWQMSEGPAYDSKNGQPVTMSSPIYENAHIRASIQPSEYPGYIRNLMQDVNDQISSHQKNKFGL